jgi:hypothetical protein
VFRGYSPVRTGDTEQSGAYAEYMLTTLLVIGGVLVGLVALLALIVSLSARPNPAKSSSGWVADTGRSHPDAWTPPTSEIPAAR